MQYLDPLFLIQTLGLVGVLSIIFAESGLFFGFFLPGDSLLFTAGLLASQNYLNIFYLLLFGSIAAILGDSVGYAFGKKIGPKLFTKEDSFLFNKKYIDKSKVFFEKYGKKAIILARFIPGVRTFTPIIAGVGTMPYRQFITYNIIGGAGWVIFMTCLGYFFGRLVPNPDKYIIPIVILIAFVSITPGLIEYIRGRKK
ncbi:MAG: VTT domain-containing protein [Candidatus Paceibacterota bacterium]